MSDEAPEVFMVADDMLLVDGYRVALGAGGTIGQQFAKDGPMFIFTFEGRVNKSQERRTVHMLMHAEFGYQLGEEVMSRLEEFIKLAKGRQQ